MSTPLVVLSLSGSLAGWVLGLAPGSRPMDPAVPTSVPAPAGVEVEEPIDVPTAEDDDAPAKPTTQPASSPAASRAAAERTAAARKAAAAAAEAAAAAKEPSRRGGMVLGSIGAAGCPQDQCNALRAIPWFGIHGGYRFGRFAPLLTIQGGIGPSKNEGDTRSMLHIGAGTLLHLLARTRFDPYFGLTVGFLQTRVVAPAYVSTDADPETVVKIDLDERVNRGALGIVLGLGFRLGKRWTIGPRVDVLVPFAGKVCTRADGEDLGCTDISKVESVDPGQFFPRPWAATFQVGAFI